MKTSAMTPLLLASLALVPGTGQAASGGEISISIVEPDRGDLLTGQAMLRAEAQAPAGVLIEKVTFVVDGTPLSIDRSPPYEALWDGINPLRDHLIRVTAEGSDGSRAYDLLSIPILGMVTRVSVTDRAPEFVLLSVTFLDGNGHPLVDVEKDEVRVVEDDREQVVDVLAPDDRPLAAELLLDASQSTKPFWQKLSQSTRLFAETLREGDRAAVEAFNNVSFPLAPLGSSPEEIETATSSFQDWGGATRLYDALSRGALLLLGREETRRRALVVLTDAADWGSTLTSPDTDEYLRRGEVEIHAVLLRPANMGMLPRSRDYDFHSLQKTLVEMAARSGGMEYDATHLPMEEVFVRIGEQLRAQYLLGYYSVSEKPAGDERRVEVQLLRPGSHRVRVRRGHFGGETLGQYLAAEMSRGPERRRITAVRAGRLHASPEAAAAMVEALGQGKDLRAGVSREARLALLDLGPSSVPHLKRGLDAPKARQRRAAAQVLVDLMARLSGPELEAALAGLGDGDREAGRSFLEALGREDLPAASRDRLAQLLETL